MKFIVKQVTALSLVEKDNPSNILVDLDTFNKHTKEGRKEGDEIEINDGCDCGCADCSIDRGNMSDSEYYEALGKYYGYPQCCIDRFIYRAKCSDEDGIDIPLTDEQEGIIDGDGFVPCTECAERVTVDNPLWALIFNRVCSSPYPEDGSNEELQEYIKSQPTY